MTGEEEPVDYPLDGVLDLHMFRPAEVRDVLLAYLESCHEHGIRELRIIHGKGIGVQREQVHAVLSRHGLVESFRLAPGDAGGWGATLVRLKRKTGGPTS